MIISTVQGRKGTSDSSILGSLEISNVYLSDSTFEGGSAFFVSYSIETKIKNFTARSLGYYDVKSEFKGTFDLAKLVNLATSSLPIFDCHLRAAGLNIKPSSLSASRLFIGDIGGLSGIPAFRLN